MITLPKKGRKFAACTIFPLKTQATFNRQAFHDFGITWRCAARHLNTASSKRIW